MALSDSAVSDDFECLQLPVHAPSKGCSNAISRTVVHAVDKEFSCHVASRGPSATAKPLVAFYTESSQFAFFVTLVHAVMGLLFCGKCWYVFFFRSIGIRFVTLTIAGWLQLS